MWRTYRDRLWAGLAAGAQVAGRTLSKAWHDRIMGMSAESAFWQMLSFPSMMIALVGLIGVAARWLGPDAVDQIRDWALDAASGVVTPRVVNEVVRPVVNEVLERNRTDVISISTIVALWTGSSATATFVNTITIAYGQRKLRNAVRSRLVALRLYLFTVLAGVVVLPAVVFGPGALDSAFSGTLRRVVSTVMHSLYWPVLGLVVFAGITTFYHWATPVRLRWRRAFPGALLALTLFLVISYGLQVYIAEIAATLRVYSTLAAPVLALMYFYGLAFAVLLGAEFNAALEERWPRGTRQPMGGWLLETATRVRNRHSGDDEPADDDPGGKEPPADQPDSDS
jgi:membrane protein